jgi:hypothetical protein
MTRIGMAAVRGGIRNGSADLTAIVGQQLYGSGVTLLARPVVTQNYHA